MWNFDATKLKEMRKDEPQQIFCLSRKQGLTAIAKNQKRIRLPRTDLNSMRQKNELALQPQPNREKYTRR